MSRAERAVGPTIYSCETVAKQSSVHSFWSGTVADASFGRQRGSDGEKDSPGPKVGFMSKKKDLLVIGNGMVGHHVLTENMASRRASCASGTSRPSARSRGPPTTGSNLSGLLQRQIGRATLSLGQAAASTRSAGIQVHLNDKVVSIDRRKTAVTPAKREDGHLRQARPGDRLAPVRARRCTGTDGSPAASSTARSTTSMPIRRPRRGREASASVIGGGLLGPGGGERAARPRAPRPTWWSSCRA